MNGKLVYFHHKHITFNFFITSPISLCNNNMILDKIILQAIRVLLLFSESLLLLLSMTKVNLTSVASILLALACL